MICGTKRERLILGIFLGVPAPLPCPAQKYANEQGEGRAFMSGVVPSSRIPLSFLLSLSLSLSLSCSSYRDVPTWEEREEERITGINTSLFSSAPLFAIQGISGFFGIDVDENHRSKTVCVVPTLY